METIALVIRNMLQVYPNVSQQRISDVVDVLTGQKVACEPNKGNLPPMEPPIKPKEAAKMLGVTTKALEYHVRKGRIRVVKLKGSLRSFGYVAEDIRELLKGTNLGKAA